MNVGKMIFYDKTTNEIIISTGEYKNVTLQKTAVQQIATYKELSERNRETFDVVELEYGQHAQDFAVCNGYRVNIETKKLEFSYPVPGEPTAPILYEQPLSSRFTQIEDAVNFLLLGGI